MRRELLRSVCKRYANQTPSILDYDEITANHTHLLKAIVVSERHKALFSPIAKVACSSWKSMLFKLSGDFNNRPTPNFVHSWPLLQKHGWTQLYKYNITHIRHVLETYTKFVVVRHPYSRLHSAFTDKFQRFPHGKPNPIYPKKFGGRAIRRYWENPSPQALRTGLNISFEDFVHFVGDPDLSPGYKFDYHWMPYHYVNIPCLVKYDYILKLETMSEDTDHFLKDVLHVNYELPHRNNFQHTKLTAYDNVSLTFMTNLWNTYHLDVEMYGYTWPITAS